VSAPFYHAATISGAVYVYYNSEMVCSSINLLSSLHWYFLNVQDYRSLSEVVISVMCSLKLVTCDISKVFWLYIV